MVETSNRAGISDSERIKDGLDESTASLLARLGSKEAASIDALRVYQKLEPLVVGESNDTAFLAVHTLLLALLEQIESADKVK